MIQKFLSAEIRQQIELLLPDREYGFIVRFGALIPLQNFSQSNQEVIFDSKTLQPGDEIIHTHFGDMMGGVLSNDDIVTALDLKIGVYLYHSTFRVWDYFNPNFPHPYPLAVNDPKLLNLSDYLALPYSDYRCNCYTLIRDYAKGILNIDYPYININSKNGDIQWFFKNPEQAGFKRQTESLAIGNIVIFYISREIPFHVGIVVNLKPFLQYLHILNPVRNSEILRLDTRKRNIVSVWKI